MECGLLLNESRRGGVIIWPFLKLLCGFGIKQSPKLPWRELLGIKSKLFRIDGERQSRMLVS